MAINGQDFLYNLLCGEGGGGVRKEGGEAEPKNIMARQKMIYAMYGCCIDYSVIKYA